MIGMILEKHKLKTVFKPSRTIQQSLISAKEKQDPLSASGVYRIPCSCGSVYIGTTNHSVNMRIAEHKRSWRLWLHSWHFPPLCLRKRVSGRWFISHSPNPTPQNRRKPAVWTSYSLPGPPEMDELMTKDADATLGTSQKGRFLDL